MVVVANDLGAPTNAPAGCRLPAIAANERSRALEILLAIIDGKQKAKNGRCVIVRSIYFRVIGDNDIDFRSVPVSKERDGSHGSSTVHVESSMVLLSTHYM